LTADVAIIGCGLIGGKRAQALGGRARVVSVFDLEPARAKALAESLPGNVAVASDAAEAAERAAGGLAIVATTHEALAATALDALDAGCHVLIEKPGARSSAELQAVKERADGLGRVVRVGFNHRFHPALLRARSLLAGSPYGEVLLVRARYGHGGRLGYEREWRADRARSGGGELLDQGVHLIDLTRFLAGEVELAYAALPTLFWPMEVEDNALLHLRLAGGGQAWLHASWTEWKNLFSLEVACRTAKLEVTGLGGSYGPERLTLYEMGPEMGPPHATTWEAPPGDSSWAAESDDVLAAIQTGERGVGADVDDALATLDIVKEAYRR
jgi:predicted dehydrogenase